MKLATKIPGKVYLAISGGRDSMMAYHFLRQGRRLVKPIFFHHGTEFSDQAYHWLLDRIDNLTVGFLRDNTVEGSPEEFWRNKRYEFFDRFTDRPVVLAHTLTDNLETMIMTFCHGQVRSIPTTRSNYIRPFLNTTREEVTDYCRRHNVEYLDDPTNLDGSNVRSHVRNNILPLLFQVNPGLYKSCLKLVAGSH